MEQKKKKNSYFEANMLEKKNSSHKSLYKITTLC